MLEAPIENPENIINSQCWAGKRNKKKKKENTLIKTALTEIRATFQQNKNENKIKWKKNRNEADKNVILAFGLFISGSKFPASIY